MCNGWNGLSGTLCEAPRALFVDKHYLNALFDIQFYIFILLYLILFFLSLAVSDALVSCWDRDRQEKRERERERERGGGERERCIHRKRMGI